ncbi:uncharacterized protein LOC126991058 [Eriocheir sinensis]|uniref:uncharacterized protein LOC126991058 n=1 Tax=Eriocheir sinensis TaxID=95602 RepID=UPI0021C88315|nr:uncharacterized protein LOC126991058 [Eriocheir sinensis]
MSFVETHLHQKMATSQKTRSSIIALHEVGFSNGYIARELGVSKPTVVRWIQRYIETGDTKHKLGAGRPRCTTPAQDAAIANIIDNAPFTTAPAIRHQTGLPCSSETIRNRHHERDLHARVPAKKPKLTDLDIERRMEYALEYAEKPAPFWDNVVFCDEKTFSTDERTTTRVWRHKNERYDSRHVVGTRRSG